MTNEQRLDTLYWLEASQDEVMVEGANLDVRRIFVKHRKNLKVSCKEVRNAYKNGDYSTAKKKIQDTKKIIDKMYADISRIQKTEGIGSWIFGWVTGNVMFIGRTIIGNLFSPLGRTFISVTNLIERVTAIMNDVKNEKRDIDIDDFNLYINGIKVRLNEYKQTLDKFATLIEEDEKAVKQRAKK